MNHDSDHDGDLEASSVSKLHDMAEGEGKSKATDEELERNIIFSSNAANMTKIEFKKKRKRPISGSEGWETSNSGSYKKPALNSAENKRTREKERRSGLNETLEDLADLVFQIDPSLRSGRAEAFGVDNTGKNIPSGRKNTITNRTELIQCTVRLLRRIHSENQQKDKAIEDLTNLNLSIPLSQKAAQSSSNSLGSLAAKGDFTKLREQTTALIPKQSAYSQIMSGQLDAINSATRGRIAIAKGGANISGLMFPGPYSGLLQNNGGQLPPFPGTRTHGLFGPGISHQQPHHNLFSSPFPITRPTSGNAYAFLPASETFGIEDEKERSEDTNSAKGSADKSEQEF
jgi:hypothetical protein